MTLRCFWVVVCSFALTMTAFTQSDRGTITGTVSDATGAVIPGVAIEAKNSQTGATYQAGSSETGNYTLAQLPAGTYELSANLPGFKRYLRSGIIVSVATTLRIDVALEVGQAGDSVTVEAASPLLKTESGEVSHNITAEQADSLPVLTLSGALGTTLGNVRNPLQVINLLPGASFANENQLRVNGMPSSTHSIRIEGQDATNGMYRQINQGVQASVDAIQEVAVQTSNYAAEYGQAGGGYFNYTMKSGTNQFHGAVFDYFVNEALHAGTPVTDRVTTGDTSRAGQHIRNRQRKNDYGFNIGGPIALGKLYDGHNKSFFFFNFEQFRETQFVSSGLATVPTLKMRNGDFSEILGPQLTIGGTPAVDPFGRPVRQNAIYNPATTRVAPDGTRVRDPYDNNIIPVGQFDPVGKKIQDLLPLPTNNQLLINNYTIPTYENFRHTTIPSFKIDHNINDKNKLSFYFSTTRTRSPQANGFETQPYSSVSPTESNAYTVRLNYDRTLSPTMLLHVGAGVLYQNVPSLPPTFDQSSLGWAKNFYVDLFPQITGLSNTQFGGTSIALGSFSPYKYSKDLKPTLNTSLTWVSGNHSFKMGGELIVEGLPTLNYTRANGVLGFALDQSSIGSWQDGRGLNSTTGLPYASFLLGRTSSLTLSQVTSTRLGNHSMAFYAQDSWKITRKLTFGYGLR